MGAVTTVLEEGFRGLSRRNIEEVSIRMTPEVTLPADHNL
jgi:hypothetical protein